MESVIGWRVVILLVEMLRLCDMYHLLNTNDLAVTPNQNTGIIIVPAFTQINIWNCHDMIFPAGCLKCLYNLAVKFTGISGNVLSGILREELCQLHFWKKNQVSTIFCCLFDC